MKRLKLKQSFKSIFEGLPDVNILHLDDPETVAVSAQDIPFIRPKLLVKKEEKVKIGTPLFFDKRNKCIQYVSPGCGYVKDIVFGARRKLIEVVIALEKNPDQDEDSIQFAPLQPDEIDELPKADLVKRLQEGGLWQCFREFPAKDTADASCEPPMIIVTLNGNDPFSPEPEIVLEQEVEYFKSGLNILKKLTPRTVVAVRHSSNEWLKDIEDEITHIVSDTYPSWDPGVILYNMKTCVKENRSWTISSEHLIMLAKFILTGTYPIKRVITVSRTRDKKPHIITRQGVPIKHIVGKTDKNALITTGRFNGRIVEPETHLGFFETTLNIIQKSENEEFLGFMKPGFNKSSISKTFVSCLLPGQIEPDCNLHGEERACINCGYCTNICPVDLMPSFIMKALYADDIEEALEIGLLDCCRCGLCSYTCPSKIELTQILSQGMDAHFKDKE